MMSDKRILRYTTNLTHNYRSAWKEFQAELKWAGIDWGKTLLSDYPPKTLDRLRRLQGDRATVIQMVEIVISDGDQLVTIEQITAVVDSEESVETLLAGYLAQHKQAA